MAIIDDLLSLMPPPVWRKTAPNLTALLSTFANEMTYFNSLAVFVQEQVNITTSEGEFLDLHGVDFGVSRSLNPFTDQPESDPAYRQQILNTFQQIRLNKYVLQNLLSPYSNNPAVIYEDMIDCWFVGGNPAVDFQPFSFAGFDTIMTFQNLVSTSMLVSSSTSDLVFSVSPNLVPDQSYGLHLPYFASISSSTQFTVEIPALNYQGAFEDGRGISLISQPVVTNPADITPFPASGFTSVFGNVVTQEYVNNQNVVTLDTDLTPLIGAPLIGIFPTGDTIVVAYQEPTTQYLYQWTSTIDENNHVTIQESNRADIVPESLKPAGILPLGPNGSISDYTQLDFSILSIRGQFDPMYRIDAILSFVSPKAGDAGLAGEGLFVGELQYPNPTSVNNVLYYNKLAGIQCKTFIVSGYTGNFLDNSNNINGLFG